VVVSVSCAGGGRNSVVVVTGSTLVVVIMVVLGVVAGVVPGVSGLVTGLGLRLGVGVGVVSGLVVNELGLIVTVERLAQPVLWMLVPGELIGLGLSDGVVVVTVWGVELGEEIGLGVVVPSGVVLGLELGVGLEMISGIVIRAVLGVGELGVGELGVGLVTITGVVVSELGLRVEGLTGVVPGRAVLHEILEVITVLSVVPLHEWLHVRLDVTGVALDAPGDVPQMALVALWHGVVYGARDVVREAPWEQDVGEVAGLVPLLTGTEVDGAGVDWPWLQGELAVPVAVQPGFGGDGLFDSTVEGVGDDENPVEATAVPVLPRGTVVFGSGQRGVVAGVVDGVIWTVVPTPLPEGPTFPDVAFGRG